MADRIPVFELHIRPMFRWIDREHMNRRSPPLDLADYQQLRARAEEILDWLSSDDDPMPVRRAGGPWPKEWIDLFRRWTQTDFHRLSLGTAKTPALVSSGQFYELSCKVDLPDQDARSWLEYEEAMNDRMVYRLCLEPTPGAGPAIREIVVREFVRGPLTVSTVFLHDSAGEHRLDLPVA